MPALTRRSFLAIGAATAGGLGSVGTLLARAGLRDDLPTIRLGRTASTVPRLGLGCFPLGQLANDDEAHAVLLRALDLGVRYLDTAPSYANGRSERRVGRAVAEWLAADASRARADLFIATKTLERTADGARRELERSLERLGLDHVDTIQCHEVHDDWESLFAAGGAIEGLNKAREGALCRHVAITGHRNPKYLIEAIRRFPPRDDGSGFVTALVPINPIDVQHLSFVREFLPFAAEQGVAAIAMKIFGGGFLLGRTLADGTRAYTPGDLLRYALAQPGVALAVPGCDQVSHVETDRDAVAAFAQPEPAWLAEIEARAGTHEGKTTEWYKDELPEGG